MDAKDGITGYVCTNADGLHKLPMTINEKAKSLQNYRLGSCLVFYFSQQNSSSDSVMFFKCL